MLERLEIDQLALIEHAELEFNAGFQVITGETGAGKSLLLGAVGAISGQPANRDLIRSGAEEALVEAVFTLVNAYFTEDPDISELLDEDEDALIIGREVRQNGRNLCRLNGRIVPLALLRKVGETLADIHGQNDRQQIFRADKHLGILDRYGHQTITPLLTDYTRAYQAWQALLKQEAQLVADPEERRILTERLQYQINEIQAVSPVDGEEIRLRERRDMLAHVDKLQTGLSKALSELQGDGTESGADLALAAAYSEVLKLSAYADLEVLIRPLAQAQEALSEAVKALYTLLDQLDARPGELEEVDRRLDQLTRLQRKYGETIPQVLDFLAKAEARLEAIEETEQQVEALAERKEQLKALLEERGLALRKARQAAAEALSSAIMQELKGLGMADAVFQVRFTELAVAQAKAKGLDQAEFMLAANRGEALKPLAQTASGGEASRIMLAIKVILASADQTPLLVFDEIDTGISGETSAVVAQKLKRLAQTHQILCVTHQAQIAAAADTHFRIYKESDEARTRTFIRLLSQAERETEIARLLSGSKEDDNSLTLARQLLERSNL